MDATNIHLKTIFIVLEFPAKKNSFCLFILYNKNNSSVLHDTQLHSRNSNTSVKYILHEAQRTSSESGYFF